MIPVTYDDLIDGDYYVLYETMLDPPVKVVAIGKIKVREEGMTLGVSGDHILYHSIRGCGVSVDEGTLWGVYPSGNDQWIFKLDDDEVNRHILMEIV